MKGLAKFLIVIMFLGLVTAGIGFALEGFKWDSVVQAVKTISDDDFELKEEVVETAVNKIVIDVKNDDIVLTNSTDGNVHLSYYVSKEYKKTNFSVNGDTVKLESKYLPKMWFTFSVNLGTSDKVSVAVPEGFIGEIDFHTSNGNIKSEVANTFANLALKTSNGKITLKNLTVINNINLKTTNGGFDIANADFRNALTAKASNGDIKLNDVAVGTKMELDTSNSNVTVTGTTVYGITEIESTNGNIRVENCVFNAAELETSNGKIYANNLTVKNLEADSSNGDIDLTINGNYNDYRVYVQTSNGNRYVNGAKVSNGTHNNGANLIKAETSNSNINIKFQ